MTRKTILMLVLGLVATGCLFSTVTAQPKDSTDKTQPSKSQDVTGCVAYVVGGVARGESGGSHIRFKVNDAAIIGLKNEIAEIERSIKKYELEIERAQLSKGEKDPKEIERRISELSGWIIDLKQRKANFIYELKKINNQVPSADYRDLSIQSLPAGAWNEEMIKLHRTLGMLKAIGDTAFDPESAALIGIGAINDEFALTPQETAAELEAVLQSTQSLGLRNAIRITLKDIYLKAGDKKKGIEQMRAMIAENDKRMYDAGKSEPGEINKK